MAEAAAPRWQDQANCQGVDPNLFFPETDRDAEEIKKICRDCPVRRDCLDFAIATRQDTGVWGGTTEQERRRLRRRRR